MLRKYLFFVFLLSGISGNVRAQNTAKPWAYWWWPGSAVNKQDIQTNLKSYAKAGFGGMHIIPIYGVKGEEEKFISYLSPQWLEILDYTTQQAKKLGLGIDMSVGTGWPFGGAHVTEQDAAKNFRIVQTGDQYDIKVAPTRQKVKRAAPGGEGFVVDHFDKTALDHYFRPFQEAFSKKNYGVRAFYNDSYEVYGANWTALFPEKFKAFRGYDLMPHLNVLAKNTADTDLEKRIWSDYHETISDLLYENFTKSYVAFGHKFNKPVRNESHGSPANILDLYALSDIPESEFFGSKPYNIPLYRQDPDYQESRFGMPDASVLKLASSPAHITGKKLVSSETSTWLGNHFKVALSQIKPLIDESLTGGINHIFYHGLTYSPPAEPFPGWLFYASTNYNQNSHFYEALPQLNGYIERCQDLLQKSVSDNDVLLYFPIYDLWHTASKKEKIHLIDVHNIKSGGVFTEIFRKTIDELNNHGYSFDFVSDKQIAASAFKNGKIATEGGTTYQTIVVPPIDYISLRTLQKLQELRKKGAKIIFADRLPKFVNGFHDWEKRQAEFDKIIREFKSGPLSGLNQTLRNAGVRQEKIAESGLNFIRQKTPTGHIYFITNQNTRFKSGKITLASTAASVRFFNPMTKESGLVDFKKLPSSLETDLSLAPGESIFIETFSKKQTGPAWKTFSPAKDLPLSGNWKVDFIKGEPFIPKSFETKTLGSWTDSQDTLAAYFSGKARYSLNFSVEEALIGKRAEIDLGDVRETALVKINGKEIGSAWAIPFKVQIPAGLLKKNNLVEIEVTNLSINRVRYLDKKGVPWKKFYDINIVDIQYKPFDASGWAPVESGLLGPVILRF